MHLRSLRAAACGAAVLLAAACGAGPAPAADGSGPMVIGVTTLFPTGTLAEFTAALQATAAEHDMVFEVQDVGNDAAKENRFLSAFATRQVDLVMASVVSPTGSIAALQRLQAAGVPVVCYNTCLNPPDDQRLTRAFVTNDQAELGRVTGRAAADHIRDRLGGRAKVAYLTCETYDVCKQRRAGLDEALAGVQVEVVAAQEGFVVDKATPVATSILTAHPDVDVIIAENEDAVVAAANAVAARGQTGRTVVFGIGINPTVADLLLQPEGVVQQVTGQDAEAWAREAIAVAEAIRDGRDPGTYHHFTPGPSFSRADPGPIEAYRAARQG
jgi:simple sugar transport system substrate-binding protein